MRSDRCAVLFTVVALSLAVSPLLAAAGPAPSLPCLSEEQARQRAAAVAKEIGLLWDDTAVATAAGSDWLVQCHRTTLRIEGDTGRIASLKSSRTAPRTRTEEPVTEEEAVAIAARALKVFGAPTDATVRAARQFESTWSISWMRTAGGIPYDGDLASMFLDGAGRVRQAQLKWAPGAPPTTTEVKVTKEQAVQAAKDFVKRARLPGSHDEFIDARLWVVLPNDRYAAHPSPRPEANPATRVAWAVSFPRSRSGSPTTRRPGPGWSTDWMRDVVWIDAADARVLGGRTGPAAPPSAETIQRLLAHRRAHAAVVAGGIAAAVLAVVAVGLVVRARRRPRAAGQAL